nr:DUF1403 family protein [Agrobacterium vitis]
MRCLPGCRSAGTGARRSHLGAKAQLPKPVPLLLPERFGPAFRTIGGGRGRVRPGEPAYPKAICPALADGVDAALRSAVEFQQALPRFFISH